MLHAWTSSLSTLRTPLRSSHSRAPTFIIGFLILAFTMNALPLPRAAATSITSTLGTPTIDGSLGYGEWNIANQLALPHGFMTVLNDATRLYFLIDLTGDNVKDPPLTSSPWGDYFWLTFDVNKDGAITRNVDLNYGFLGNYNMRYQYYLGPGTWTGLQPNTRSSLGAGFGCFSADNTFTITWILFFPIFHCQAHRVWEIGIDLSEVGASPGGSVKVGLETYSQNPSFKDDTPTNFYNDFSNLITINLASATIPPSNPAATFSFETNPIEVTQAIQTRTNSLPIVQDKATAARVYVDTSGATPPQPVVVYLYGTRGGLDLPGSPIEILHSAPGTVDRGILTNTANFVLPAAWASGTIQLHALARSLGGTEVTSSMITLSFTHNRTPILLYVPVRVLATSMSSPCASPDAAGYCVPDNGIQAVSDWMTAIYPVASMQYIELPVYTENNLGNLWGDLATLRTNWMAANPCCADGSSVRTVKIYGWLPQGAINNGYGIIGGDSAKGDQRLFGLGTYGDMTIDNMLLSHEIGHTYGLLHPRDEGTPPTGCTSTGYNDGYTSIFIVEVGLYVSLMHLKPTTMHDFMMGGHCVPLAEEKWIGPTSWGNLNAVLPWIILLSDNPPAPEILTPNVIVSGTLYQNGTGKLNPIYSTQAPFSPTPGPYVIQMLNSTNQVVAAANLTLTFPHGITGPDATNVSFATVVPFPPGTTHVRFMNGTTLLDSLSASASAPTVSITFPTGGQTLQGVQNIQWTANDPDGDPLTFQVQSSIDGGASWNLLASGLTGNSFKANFDDIPGSNNSRIRIVVSDGFYSTSSTSGTLIIPDKPPSVSLLSPSSGEQFSAGAKISFQARATDIENNSIPDNSFIWSSDGKVFGTGRQFQAVLPGGTHQLNLTVVDNAGKSTTLLETITVMKAPATTPIFTDSNTGRILAVALLTSLILLTNIVLRSRKATIKATRVGIRIRSSSRERAPVRDLFKREGIS